VRRIGQHLESLDGIGLERAVEDQESSESESNLDLIPSELVDLRGRRKEDGGQLSTNSPSFDYIPACSRA